MSQVIKPSGSKSYSTYRSYQRIESDLREQIAGGRWQNGVALPTRFDLARHYGVDRNTLQRAVNALLADGTLVSLEGVRGTFVADSPLLTPNIYRTVNPVLSAEQTPYDESAVQKASPIYGIVINSPGSDGISDSWYDRIVRAAERTATMSGSASRFASFTDESAPFFDSVSEKVRTMLAADRMDGLIVISLHDDDQSLSIDRIMQRYQLPVVYVSSVEAQYPIPHVYYDQSEAGFQAARHVIGKGHTRMTFVAPVNMIWVRDRIEGARTACRLTGLPDSALTVYPAVVPDNINPHSVIAEDHVEFGSLFDSNMPSAIIGCNDKIALNIKRAGELGGKIAGRDYLLMGFDDLGESRLAGLSTLSPPLEALGEEAAKMLPRLIDGSREGTQVRLRSHLVQRASSGA